MPPFGMPRGGRTLKTMMKKTTFIVRTAVIVAALSQLGACAMTHTQRNAGIGAAAGGALGYLVTGGPLGTVAGAAAGGIVGANVR
ncbi:ornithine acetyltransferase [Burkholderia contaminans]|jgi:osmotically inducible lipoprotein OsmB|nr:ornithine acetyltransferase [Burkholderia contaminans]VWC90096.1 ornithine acetyltransferase [Burkholderia contaminans]